MPFLEDGTFDIVGDTREQWVEWRHSSTPFLDALHAVLEVALVLGWAFRYLCHFMVHAAYLEERDGEPPEYEDADFRFTALVWPILDPVDRRQEALMRGSTAFVGLWILSLGINPAVEFGSMFSVDMTIIYLRIIVAWTQGMYLILDPVFGVAIWIIKQDFTLNVPAVPKREGLDVYSNTKKSWRRWRNAETPWINTFMSVLELILFFPWLMRLYAHATMYNFYQLRTDRPEARLTPENIKWSRLINPMFEPAGWRQEFEMRGMTAIFGLMWYSPAAPALGGPGWFMLTILVSGYLLFDPLLGVAQRIAGDQGFETDPDHGGNGMLVIIGVLVLFFLWATSFGYNEMCAQIECHWIFDI